MSEKVYTTMKRYDQMLAIIEEVKPSFIVEVGVHRAVRAVQLCEHALKFSAAVRYLGFDVFDTVPASFHEAALNGKGIPTMESAYARMNHMISSKYESRFSYRFVIGDTRETLHGKHIHPEFAFIDGDHRVEAIEGDYAALSGCPCVVFDDYYTTDKEGRIVDLEKFGANQIIDRLQQDPRLMVEILPAADQTKSGGCSQLAVVRRVHYAS